MPKNNIDINHISSQQSFNEIIKRAYYLSIIFAISFGLFAFQSIEFIKQFNPNITFWLNLWPRILFNVIPFLVLALFSKRSKCKPQIKLLIWVSSFALILHTASWIHVWPIALSGKAQIFTYVHAANIVLTAFVFIILAPPPLYLLLFIALMAFIFWAPLFVIAWIAGDIHIFKLMMGDTLANIALSSWASSIIYGLRKKIISLENQKLTMAKGFLNDTVSEAIFENKPNLLEKRKVNAFILTMDLRNFTELITSNNSANMMLFLEKYHSIVTSTITEYRGTIHKTMGDGHLISFGIKDDLPNIKDIPDQELEQELAEKNRYSKLLDKSIQAYETILKNMLVLLNEEKAVLDIQIAAAIDFGEVEIKVIGDQFKKELDIFGTVVNRCNRLVERSKKLATRTSNSSLISISPQAAIYLKANSQFLKEELSEDPIRNFPQLSWILYKTYRQNIENNIKYLHENQAA